MLDFFAEICYNKMNIYARTHRDALFNGYAAPISCGDRVCQPECIA